MNTSVRYVAFEGKFDDDMNLLGLFLHPLTGNRSDIWFVSGNWQDNIFISETTWPGVGYTEQE